MALCVDTKLIIAHQIGKKSLENTIKLLQELKKRLNEKSKLYFTSDGNNAYCDAINSVYCIYEALTKITKLPQELCYAQVIKEKKNGKLHNLDTKVVFGSEQLLKDYLSKSFCSNTINTSYVERCNLTMRQRNRRVERKSQGFSKMIAFHKAQMTISIAYYNFCLHHSSLKRYKGTKPLHFTPAIEAGITDHPWTMLELLKIRIATLNGA